MSADRTTPVDQHLEKIGRTSEVGIAVGAVEATLRKLKHARPPEPLASLAAEHVRERRLADRHPVTGLRGALSLRQALRAAWRDAEPPRLPLCLRFRLAAPRRTEPSDLGPRLVKALAWTLQANVAASDLVAQVGEMELAVLMARVDPRHAPAIAERLERVARGALCEVTDMATVELSVEVSNRR